MRRLLCLLPLLLSWMLLAPLHAQDKDKDKDKEKQDKGKTEKDKEKDKDKKEAPALVPGQVQISWHGQSFFTIMSSKGTVIVTDPHLITVYGRLIGLKADIVTMSHNHSDHVQIKAIENFDDKNLRQIRGLKQSGDWNTVDEKIKDVHIKSVALYHDSMEGLKYGKTTAFIFEVDGWRIVHLGDLGHQLSPAQIRQLGQVDVLMIPVGGIYTLNGDEAKAVVKQIKPREYILPMHCGTKIYSEVLSPDEFVDGVDKKRLVVSDDNRIVLNRDPKNDGSRWVSPWREGTSATRPLILQLHYWPKK